MWCTLTMNVDVDMKQYRFDGREIAEALLRNVIDFKVIEGIELLKISEDEQRV